MPQDDKRMWSSSINRQRVVAASCCLNEVQTDETTLLPGGLKQEKKIYTHRAEEVKDCQPCRCLQVRHKYNAAKITTAEIKKYPSDLIIIQLA